MSQTIQHRRLLSMTRRSGPQLPLDIARGRTARHQRNYSDMYGGGDRMRMLHSAVLYVGAVLMGLGMLLWFVTELAR